MFRTLFSYSFLVVALATFFLATACGVIGSITLLKGESLIADAVGHSTFPGIVLAFIIFRNRDPLTLLIGAAIMGSVAFMFIQFIDKHSKLSFDSILAVILSGFFGLGMVLKSYIQGNSKFQGASQSGLGNYIFGQAAYIMKKDLHLILIISIIVLVLVFIFYKEIKLFVFDELYLNLIGIKSIYMYMLTMILAMLLISVGIKLVGAILISSLLIVPVICAMQLSNNFAKVMALSALVGGISAVIGTYISTIVDGMSTGPTIILIMSIFAFLAMIFGKKGIIATMILRRRYR